MSTPTPIRLGAGSQQELRDLLELFLLTVEQPSEVADALRWVILDYSDIVCGSGLLFQPNLISEFAGTQRWDFAVATRRRRATTFGLALTWRGQPQRLSIQYRWDWTQCVLEAHPSTDGPQNYRLCWIRTGQCHTCDRSRVKQIMANSVSGALHRPDRDPQ